MTRAALACVLAGAVLNACGPRGPGTVARDPRPVIAGAERAIAVGSTAALHEALVLLREAHAAGLARGDVERLLVEVSALLDIREAELGMQAHAHVAALPAALARPPDQQALVELAEAIGHSLRGPGDDLAAWQRGRATVRERADAWRQLWSTRTDAVARYALLALGCWFGDLVGQPDRDQALPVLDAMPLVAWKAATCAGHDVEALRALVAREPGFAEATYLLAIDALRTGRRDEAIAGMRAAIAVWPEWVRAWVSLGHALVTVERLDEALEAYDTALRVRADPPARLGRLQVLSYLERHEAAIAQADELLAGGTWNLGDAHYWKAWNLVRLERLAEAADEVAAARRLMVNAGLMKLSGIVAFRQGRHADARADLTEALRLVADDCDARFTLAAVEAADRRAREAAGGFGLAAACYRELEEQLAGAGTSDDARVQARRERDRREARRQRGTSHVHAAEVALALGDAEAVRAHVAALAGLPEWAERAREIADRLK